MSQCILHKFYKYCYMSCRAHGVLHQCAATYRPSVTFLLDCFS